MSITIATKGIIPTTIVTTNIITKSVIADVVIEQDHYDIAIAREDYSVTVEKCGGD